MNEESRKVEALEEIAEACKRIADSMEHRDANKTLEDEALEDPGYAVPGHPVDIYCVGDGGHPVDIYRVDGGVVVGEFVAVPDTPAQQEALRAPVAVRTGRRAPTGRQPTGGKQRASTGSYGAQGVERRGCLEEYVEEIRHYARTHTYEQTHRYVNMVIGVQCGFWAVRDILQGRTYRIPAVTA